MTSSFKSSLVLLSILSIATAPAAFSESVTEMIKKAEKLRASAFEQHREGQNAAALASIQEAADIVTSSEYRDMNKPIMEKMITAQLTSIQGAAFQKKDWAMAESALRKKIHFMEAVEQTDNNDYQASLRMLDTVLRAQKKPTESGVLQAKMKPLKEERGYKPIPPLKVQ